MQRQFNQKKHSLALRIIAAMGAYKPRVTIMNPDTLEQMRLDAKRRRRPLTGRGNYGVNLMSKFADLRDAKRRAGGRRAWRLF